MWRGAALAWALEIQGLAPAVFDSMPEAPDLHNNNLSPLLRRQRRLERQGWFSVYFSLGHDPTTDPIAPALWQPADPILPDADFDIHGLGRVRLEYDLITACYPKNINQISQGI